MTVIRPIAILTALPFVFVSLGGVVGSVQPAPHGLAHNERHPGECTDESGLINVPDGLTIGGPEDNRDREPYKTWWENCGFFTDEQEVTLWFGYQEILADVEQCRHYFAAMRAMPGEPSWIKARHGVDEYCGTPPPGSDVLPNGTIALNEDRVTISMDPGTASTQSKD